MKFHLIMIKYILGFFLAIFSLNLAAAEDCFPEQDKTNRILVYDKANILSAAQVSSLNQRLISTSNNTSNQIVVVFTDDLCGMDKAMYATELGQSWGVGRKGEDNGVVIVVKPKRAGGRGEVFIAPGYGLEGVIPDATAKMVVDNEMIPFFKQNDYFRGVDAALDVIIPLAKQEFNYQAYEQKVSKKRRGRSSSFYWLILVFGIFFILSKLFSARSYAERNNMSFWSAFMMGSFLGGGLGGGSHRGGWDNFSGGGGGFGGFGGGGFGGGGSGGSW